MTIAATLDVEQAFCRLGTRKRTDALIGGDAFERLGIATHVH